MGPAIFGALAARRVQARVKEVFMQGQRQRDARDRERQKEKEYERTSKQRKRKNVL